MEHKSFPAKMLKVAGEDAPDGEKGTFEAIVSVFGNVDWYGDKVMPGAFKTTLAEWADSGDPIPIYYSHRMDDPEFLMGHVLEAAEVDANEKGTHPAGLWVKGLIDQGDDASRVAKQVETAMRKRRITQFSFSYDVIKGGPQKDGDEEFFALEEMKLYELGPTPIGANTETDLLGLKHLGGSMAVRQKVGAVLSARNKDALVAARDAIDSVLKNAEPDDESNSGGKSQQGKAEDRASGKAEDPVYDPARDARLLQLKALELED